MKEIDNYIKFFLYPDIIINGYLFLEDDDLFVIDMISDLLTEYDNQFSERKLTDRKQRLLLLKNYLNKQEITTNSEKKSKERIITLFEYQLFLDRNNYNKSHKKIVRELIIKSIKKQYKNLIQVKERYFYNPKKVKLVFIESVNSLISELYNKDSLFFRGHSNIYHQLIPGIYRTEKLIKNEHKMFREIILRNPNNFINTKTAFEKLTIMQHYGLPTRLLDITKNPLVALFFACKENDKKIPGEVIVFNPKSENVRYYDSDTVSVLANLSKSVRTLKYIADINKFNKDYLEGIKLIHLIKEEKPYFLDVIKPKDLLKTIIVRPINNNERIKRQQGYFFIFGFNNNILKPASINSIYKVNGIIPKFIIDNKDKNKVLKELDVIGINEDFLFPEIDNGTKYIKEKFDN